MPARLPLSSQRLIIVTGKGGVGKSAVTAALARAAARAGRRVLAVDVGRGRLGALLGAPMTDGEPRRVKAGPWVASIEAEEALADFVHGVLRLRMLARRLLESTSFQVVAAAAPGLAEYLVLHKLAGWVDARRLGRAVWDLVLVDAPASGHSLPLLEAPRTLGAFARFGPVADGLRRHQAMLADPARTLVCVVTTPEELAVRETIELHHALTRRLALPVAPPIVNALPPRRFGTGDQAAIERLDAHPWVTAARFHIERRREAARQVAVVRRALGAMPIRLPFLFEGPEDPRGLERLTDDVAAVAGFAA